MFDFHREAARPEVRVLENVLRGVDDSPLEAETLRALEQRLGVRLGGELAHRARHAALMLSRLGVPAPHRLPRGAVQEFAQILYQAFLFKPREQVNPLLFSPRADADVHPAPVAAQNLPVGGRSDGGVASGLPLNRLARH